MNINNFRNKRKNINKALQSIPLPYCNQPHIKMATEKTQIRQPEPKQSYKIIAADHNFTEDRGIKVLKRYYRYKQDISEERDTVPLGKYRSLQLGQRKLKKRSQQKFHAYNSIEHSPYKPIRDKRSANNLGALEHLSDQNSISKMYNKQHRKSNLPKRLSVGAPRLRQNIFDHSKKNQGTQNTAQLKDLSRIQMKKGNFSQALKILQKISSDQDDTQLLDLIGICYMNLKQFQLALVKFSKLLYLDKHYNKQVYISSALCENQLNNSDKCMHYIHLCIQLWPEYYEAYYFKGKVLYKQQMYEQALAQLRQAARLNQNKKQIKLLMGECYEKMGNVEEALKIYQQNISEIDCKNIKYAVKLGSLWVVRQQEKDIIGLLQKCLTMIESVKIRNSQIQDHMLQCNYLLCLVYFRKRNYQLSIMKAEQIMKSGSNQWILQTVKIMIVIKIKEHNFYAATNLMERLQFLNIKAELLKQYSTFCEGVILLMKKKVNQGMIKLQQLSVFFKNNSITQLNSQINSVYHMYLHYGYFLVGRYTQALAQLSQQRKIQINEYYEPILRYNEILSKAILQFNAQHFQQANDMFKHSLTVLPNKKQSHLYIAITYFKIYFLQTEVPKNIQILMNIISQLNYCADAFAEVNSNYASNIFYYRGLYYAWQGEWALAACDLDLAIDKSQDNFFKFFYLRACILANLQNYKQAISDCSVALSLDEQDADCYLLRARCLQIDGNPTQAFSDLQTFIALRPQDKQIHKFAGHMLFQNGAFEDALQAYSQGDPHNQDIQVYLTRSKTYFLLGNFVKCSSDMLQAYGLFPQCSQFLFDYEIMKWMGDLFHQFVKNQTQDQYQFNKSLLQSNMEKLDNFYKLSFQTQIKYGKIFKLPQYLTLSALCYFHLQNYTKAIDQFIEVIELKKVCLQKSDQNEGQFQQDQSEKLMFINQMYYNVAVSYCMLQNYPNAQRYLMKCQISQQLHNYEVLLQLQNQIKGSVEVDETDSYMDLFSLRNKLSKYLPYVKVPFHFQNSDTIKYRCMKICIPYPKVQPPEINPKFDMKLIHALDINQIQRRPDAPWIYREHNSVKFTDRIDVYSRFQMEKSQAQKQQRKMHIGNLMNSSSSDSYRPSLDLRDQLKLGSQIQNKLNKLLNKKKKQ